MRLAPTLDRGTIKTQMIHLHSFLNGPSPASFWLIFGLFKHEYNFTPNNWDKFIHLVSGAGIRPHDLSDTSLLLLPLDQGLRPLTYIVITYFR